MWPQIEKHNFVLLCTKSTMKRQKNPKQTWILKVVKELKVPSLTGGKCSADVGRCCKQSPPHSPLRRSAEAVCLWLQQHCCHGVASLLPAEDSLGGEIRTRVWRLFKSRFWPHVFLQALGPKQGESGKFIWLDDQLGQRTWMSINVPPIRKESWIYFDLGTQLSTNVFTVLFSCEGKTVQKKNKRKPPFRESKHWKGSETCVNPAESVCGLTADILP